MEGRREADILHRGTHPDGRPLTSADRESLLKSYLPNIRHAERLERRRAPVQAKHSASPALHNVKRRHTTIAHLNNLASVLIYKLLFLAIQLVFSLYIRSRQAYHAIVYRLFAILYYHHRTPELIRRDVRKLSRKPKHLSVIIDYDGEEDRGARRPESLRKLIEEVAEVSAWCACSGIPMLSVYERTGINSPLLLCRPSGKELTIDATGVLKSHIPSVHKSILSTFRAYFPPTSIPALRLRVPNFPNYSPPSSPSKTTLQEVTTLTLILLSASDGRETLVDLTKTLAEMSQRGKLCPSDISAELIDAELSDSSCGEPDLLILMTSASQRMARAGFGRGRAYEASPTAGADVCLRGYPPWQVRLAEIL